MASHATAAHDGHTPTSSAKYVQIAVVLFALTALEVLLFEVSDGHLKESMPGISALVSPLFVEILLGLSALKFWFVAMFYMHLKQDTKVLQVVFGFSLVIAVVIIGAMIVLFGYNRGLWWFNTPW